MSPRKFLKNLSILSVFAFILTTIGYGTYVYADKYVWTNLASPSTNWQAVAMLNGGYGYAGVGSDLYYTNSGGSTWSYLTSFGGAQYPIRSIAASEGGIYVLVSYDNVSGDGDFGVSNNYGGSVPSTAPYAAEYAGVAMSEGGQYMYVTDQTNTRLLYSNNFGQSGTWNYSSLSYTPTSVAVSNDGMYVYTATNSYILRSSDYGVNNTAVYNNATYVDIAASADGQYVYAVPSSGYPAYSSDYGVNFSDLTAAGSRSWKSVSVSGDGSRVVLVDNYGSGSQVFSSRDYGSTFTTESSVGASLWNDIALSSDGYIALLASSDSYLYTGNWDVTAPAITNIYSNTSNGAYKAGQTIQIVVGFTEALYNSSLSLTLETGTNDRSCNTSTIATGNTTATCDYVVQVGDVTSDLGTNAISGTLTDDAGNSRINDFSGALNSLASNQSIVIDAVVPTVSLTAPTNGSTASSTVSLTASASDVGTGLAGVQFRVGSTNIGVEDTSSPYAVSWDSTAVADGSYTLHAVARDVAGNYATSSATITVDNTAPAAPGTPDLVASSDVGNSNSDNITATTTPQFTSSCVTGSTVRFYQGGSTLIGTATCSATSSATIVSSTLTSGSYAITARQSDAVGNASASSSALSVTIDTSAPIISITSPVDGSYASGTISLVASSTDAVSSVYGVLFRDVNSGSQIGSEDLTSPYGVSWDTTSVLAGSTVVRATATDVAGNSASSTITVIIDNTAPSNSMNLDLVTLSDTGASTTDSFTSDTTPDISTNCENSATVRLYRAGSTLIGTGVCSSGTVTITASTLTEGTHTITAQQTDLAGNTSSASTGLSITIDTSGPSVSLTSPTTGSTVTGTISIDGTSTDSLTSVAGVLFSHGTTTISSEDTSSPYSVSFDTTTLTDGAYTLNAVARDVAGNYSTSTISVTITNAVATTNSGATQSSGPTAYSTAPSSPIPGIYNPAGNGTGNEIVSPTKVLASTIVESVGINSNFNFTKNATVRTINNEVINIQRMLNTMGYTVATTGAGSKGNESAFFGQRTRLALIRFQRAFAIPATGFFGPLSRAAMNRILNSIR